MKKLLLFYFIMPHVLFSQQLEKRIDLDSCLTSENVDEIELIKEFINYNFSYLWLSKQNATIGFIGNKYQRFHIHFSNIVKNTPNPSMYFVEGKTMVMDNITAFKGEINVLNIREIDKQERKQILEEAKKQNDMEVIDRYKYPKYIIVAEYNFKENKTQKWAGTLKGILKSYFYFMNDSIYYDDSDLKYSDSFSNNLFSGTFKSYSTGIEKKCNWGNYRIPCSGDLDIGVGDFSPNGKYLKNGWENYYKAYNLQNDDALLKEKEQWW